SSAVQAPYGVSLLANTSALPVGFALAPVTWLAGPVVATNIALTLCPALSAWACWVACRSLVTSRLAAVVAGVLFGYSPFVVTNLAVGHIGLALLVAPPLLLVGTRRLLFGPSAGRTRWAVAVGALVALQFLISSEILAIVVVVGVPCAAAAAFAGRQNLAPARELLQGAGVASLVAVLLVAAPVWWFLAGPQHLSGPLWRNASVQGNPLDAWWNPGRYGAPAEPLVHLGGYEGEEGPPPAYLGPIVLVVCGAALVAARRRKRAWLLALGAILATACSLGSLLWVRQGTPENLWLPWRALVALPMLDDVIPQRFSAVTDLCVALLIGIGIDAVLHRPAARRRAVGGRTVAATLCILASAASVFSLWSTYQTPFATRAVAAPAWYVHVAPRLPSGTTILSVPFPFPTDGSSAPMVWQAIDGMRFRLAGGYVKVPGSEGRPLAEGRLSEAYEVLTRLTSGVEGPLPRDGRREAVALRAVLAQWHVNDVVVASKGRDPSLAVRLFTRAVGRAPRHELGAWVWRLVRP
ncbi:MAG TPA: hypothetical protein VMD28_02260, partial [Acidimicrobiales bacterium]|nr:hypothetical protein [Acidimicrobiales bacterium]